MRPGVSTLPAMPARYIIVDPRVPQGIPGMHRYIGKYCRSSVTDVAGTFDSAKEARASVFSWDPSWRVRKLVRRSLRPELERLRAENLRLRQQIAWMADHLSLFSRDASAFLDDDGG